MRSLADFVNGIQPQELINKLQDALAEEFNQWYMYTIVRPFLVGLERTNVVELYDTQAKDELEDHAYWLMERISQLGGTPDLVLSPDMWNHVATHKYIIPEVIHQNPDMNNITSGVDVVSSLYQNIAAEEGAIETYSNLELFTRDRDVVTNTKIKEILADEQEHLQALKDLVADIEATIHKCTPPPPCQTCAVEEPCGDPCACAGCGEPLPTPVINPNIDAVGAIA